MPQVPVVDPTQEFRFESKSAVNQGEEGQKKLKAVLEAEGLFIKDMHVQTDERPGDKPQDEPVKPADSEPAAKEEPQGEPAAAKTETPVPPSEQSDKAKPGLKERLKLKVEALTSESTTVKAELLTERQKREALERELADIRAGKSAPSLETPPTPTTVEKTEEKPAEAKLRPKRPAAPKEEDFWEKDDPAAAYKSAQSEHETALEKYDDDLTDWRLDERDRVKREADAAARQKEATDSFKATNEADQKARIDRWRIQAAEAEAKHPDFKEKLGSAKPFTEAMIEAAHAMDQTAEIGYYLATNTEEADRIAKATALPKNPTQSQINKAMKVAFVEYAKIEAKLAEAQAADPDAGEDDEQEETPVKVETKPAAKAPEPEVKVPPKKFTPVTPVGGRGGKSQKTLAELEKSNDAADMQEIRDMPLDIYRKRKATGT